MLLKHLHLQHFKNIASLSLDFDRGIHFIVGPNGIGKTNLLDAIYYLCLGKSYFHTRDSRIVQQSFDYFRIDGYFEPDVWACIKCEPLRRKEYIWGNMKSAHLHDYIGRQPAVFISPDDTYTYIHFKEQRRKFMNQTLVQSDPEYLSLLAQHKRLQSQKLAAIKAAPSPAAVDHKLLDSYDHYLAQVSKSIAEKRCRLIEQLLLHFCEFLAAISACEQEGTIAYQTDSLDDFEEKLRQCRMKDIHAQRLHCGIHRDQLRFMLNQQSLRQFGSQGQLKSFLLALRLAQTKYLYDQTAQTPLLLLDDAFAKLDADRINAILQLVIAENILQCFITDTHLQRVKQMGEQLEVRSYIYSMNGNQFERLFDEKK